MSIRAFQRPAVTDEQRRVNSEAQSKKWQDEEYKKAQLVNERRLEAARKRRGKKRPEEVGKNISKAKKGKQQPASVKEAAKLYWATRPEELKERVLLMNRKSHLPESRKKRAATVLRKKLLRPEILLDGFLEKLSEVIPSKELLYAVNTETASGVV